MTNVSSEKELEIHLLFRFETIIEILHFRIFFLILSCCILELILLTTFVNVVDEHEFEFNIFCAETGIEFECNEFLSCVSVCGLLRCLRMPSKWSF